MRKIRKRISKKKAVDRPKEILSLYEKAVEYIHNNKKRFFLIAGIPAILIIIFATIFFLNIYLNRKASAIEYEAYRYYSVDKPYIKTQMSEEERYKKALSLYQEVVLNYPRTKKAAISLYGAGNCHFQLKNYDEAEKSYQLLIEKYPDDKFLVPLTYQKLAYLYKVKGDNEKALKNFEQLTTIENGLKDLAYMEMGSIYESQGKKDAAIGNYKKVVDEFPSSPWLSEAKNKLENLKK